MKLKLFILLLLIATSLQAQTVEEILEKVQNNIVKTNFKVDLVYSLFKGVKGTKVLETYNGKYIKNNTNFYNKIHHTETIVTGRTFIKINHDQKAILYKNFDKKNYQKSNILNLNILLKNFENPKVKDMGKSWEISMIAIEYSQMPYSKVVMNINKNDFTITKQILYLTSLVNFSENERDINIPRLEIIYGNYKPLSSHDILIFDKNRYISILNNKIISSKQLKGYDIIN